MRGADSVTFDSSIVVSLSGADPAVDSPVGASPSGSGSAEVDSVAFYLNRRPPVDDAALRAALIADELGVLTFTSNQLGRSACATNHLRAFTRL